MKYLSLERAVTVKGSLAIALIIVIPFVILCPALQSLGINALPPFNWSWPAPSESIGRALGIVDVILLSPAIESAFVFIPVWIAKKIFDNQIIASLSCAIAWSVLHMAKTDGIMIGLLSVWAFYCMSYIAWQSSRTNRTQTWLYITIIHSIINSTMLLITFLYHGVGDWS